jgi:hypothetical protein
MATPQTIPIFLLSTDPNLVVHGHPFMVQMSSEPLVSDLGQDANILKPRLLGHLDIDGLTLKLEQRVNLNATFLIRRSRQHLLRFSARGHL